MSEIRQYLSYAVVFNGPIIYETNDLAVAIGFRLGGEKGAVFGRLLPEFEPPPASPVLPRRKERQKKP